MLALLYVSGDGTNIGDAFKPLIIFVATNSGICIYMPQVDTIKLNIYPSTSYIYIYIYTIYALFVLT
jgi:hypothetical protein